MPKEVSLGSVIRFGLPRKAIIGHPIQKFASHPSLRLVKRLLNSLPLSDSQERGASIRRFRWNDSRRFVQNLRERDERERLEEDLPESYRILVTSSV